MSDYWSRFRRSRISRRRVLGTAVAGVAGVGALGLVGCGGNGDDSGGPSGSSDQPDGEGHDNSGDFKQDATLTAGIGSDVGSTDPHVVAGTGGGNWPNYAVHFATLLNVDPETSRIVPYAAEYEWTDDHSALVLRIKDGVTFHNGETLDAEVLKFNIDRLRGKADYNPEFTSGNANLFSSIETVEVVDSMTVKAVLERPDASLPFKLATQNIPLVSMQHILDGGDQAMAERPVGHGPFKFVSRQADVEIRSTRFDDFFYGQDQPLGPRTPYIKDLVQRVIPEDAARLAALEAGEIDLAVNVSADLAKSFDGRSGFKVFYLPGDQPMHIHFNTRLERDPITGGPNPLRDKRVRQAMNHAVDVDTILKNVLTGRENYSYGFSSVSLGFPDEKLKSLRYNYDPTKAKALLEEAGFGDGFEIDFTGPIGRWPNSDQVMQAVAGYLQEVGIRTRISTQQYQPWVTEVQSHTKPGMWFMGLSAGADPGNNMRYGFHSSGPYCSSYDPELGLDILIEQYEAEFDEERRASIAAEVITKQYENATWLYLYEPVTVVVGTAKIDYEFYGKVLTAPQYWKIRIRA